MFITTPCNQHEDWLIKTVNELAYKANINTPEIGIYPASDLNAFATGWNKNNALVAVSEGLMYRLSKDEIRAVLAHEMSHISNGDMVTLALIQGVVNTFVTFFARIIGNFVDKVILKNESSHGIGYGIATIVAEIFLGILASIIVMWFSRYREFRADAGGANLVGKQSMISALNSLRLAFVEQEHTEELPKNMNAFCINNTSLKESFTKLFMTHPPIEERIQALHKLL